MNNLDQDMFFGMRSQLEAIRDENQRLRAVLERIAANNDFLFLSEMADAAREALALPSQTIAEQRACIQCNVGNPGVYIKEGRMVCPHYPE